ncbi:uncharacterized protein TNCV_803161 [Trichonephila clavipes]|nr:uncharacterized protein TNCV_803161 [Trichonephila clavipes]
MAGVRESKFSRSAGFNYCHTMDLPNIAVTYCRTLRADEHCRSEERSTMISIPSHQPPTESAVQVTRQKFKTVSNSPGLHSKCDDVENTNKRPVSIETESLKHKDMELNRCPIVRVQYFVRGGFVRHRSHVSSKHLSSHLPVDGVRFLGGQKGVALQLQDARVGVWSNKDADRSRCSEK